MPGPAAALALVDELQRGVRDLLLAANPQFSWVRVLLFPTFLMLLGSEEAREQRSHTLNQYLLLLYVALAISGLVAERRREHAVGLHIVPRRFPRVGRRQVIGSVNLIAVIAATHYVAFATEIWWVGLPLGLVAAAVGVWGQRRWVRSFDRQRRAPNPMTQAPPGALGPFAFSDALQLGAALALAARVQPTVLAERLDLPSDSLVAAAEALQQAGYVRAFRNAPDGSGIVGFTRRGRRAFKRQIAALQRA